MYQMATTSSRKKLLVAERFVPFTTLSLLFHYPYILIKKSLQDVVSRKPLISDIHA